MIWCIITFKDESVVAALSLAPATSVSPVASGDSEAILSAIADPDVQLAIWQRPRPFALAPLDGLDPTGISDIDVEIAVDALRDGVARAIDDAGPGYARVRTALVAEIAQRATSFAALFRAPRLRLRLEVVQTNACWKFHMDYVPARLLATLSGRGTEWCLADQFHAVQAMTAGDIAIIKGRMLVDEPRVLHRSPPIDGSGKPRLLLAIDPVTPDRHQIA